MAEKRMFTIKVIDSDAFLDMPLSTQALYFHLNMRADDDGFVNNPRKIQRMIGASDDDLKVLIGKRFILVFDSGVIVIKHWRMHNLIRKDRYSPTTYQEELKQLDVKDNGSYTEHEDPFEIPEIESRNQSGNQMATTWQPDGNQVATQYSIGKDSIGKDSVVEERVDGIPTLEDVKAFAISRNSNIDPLRFYSYYQAGGWKDPKGNPIGNWKQKFLKWENTEPEKKTAPATSNKNEKASCKNYPVVPLEDLRKSLNRI